MPDDVVNGGRAYKWMLENMNIFQMKLISVMKLYNWRRRRREKNKICNYLAHIYLHTYLYDLHFWYEVYFISLVNMQCGLRCLTFKNNIMLIFFRHDYWKNTKDPQVMSHLRLVPNCSPKKNYLSLYLTDTGCEWYRTEMRRSTAIKYSSY